MNKKHAYQFFFAISFFVFLLSNFFFTSTSVVATLGDGIILQDARLRSAPSTVNSQIIQVLKKGSQVALLEERDGWHRLSYNNEVEGWTASWLIGQQISQPSVPGTVSIFEKARYTDNTRVRQSPSLTALIITTLPRGTVVEIIEEQTGWYRIAHSNGTTGWSTSAYLVKLLSSNPLPLSETPINPTPLENRFGRYMDNVRVRTSPSLSGAIVQTLPRGTEVAIVGESSGWYNILHTNGTTGWSMKEYIEIIPALTIVQPPITPPSVSGSYSTIGPSPYQSGIVPAEVDLAELNRYWLDKVNALRRERNVRELVLDQRWVDTATEYAVYMGTTGATNHERADGKTMHQWIDTKGLPFTTRYSIGGWQTNYFTENISWGYARGTTDEVKKVLDNAMTYYLNEASYNGPHYRTTYHPDWNSVGVGIYFKDEGNGRYRVFCVFHYGSLVL